MNLLPPALAALSFLMSGGPGLLKRQFDPDPKNDPTLTDWGKTAGWTALGAAAPMGLPALPQAAAGLFLSGGLGYPGRILDRDPNNNPSFGELLGTGMAVGLPFAFPPKAGPLAQTVADMGTPSPRPTAPAPSVVEAPAVQVAAEAGTPAAAPRQSILERLFADRPEDAAPVASSRPDWRGMDDRLMKATEDAFNKGERLSGPTAGPLWQQFFQMAREEAKTLAPGQTRPSEVLVRKMAERGLLNARTDLVDIPELRQVLQAMADGRGGMNPGARYMVHDFVYGPEATAAKYGGPNVQLKPAELKNWAGLGSQGRQTMESRVRAGREGRGRDPERQPSIVPSGIPGQDWFRVYGTNNPPLEMPMGQLSPLRQAPTRLSPQELAWAGQSLPDNVSVPAGMHDASAFTKTVEQVGQPAVKKTRTAKPKTGTAPTRPVEVTPETKPQIVAQAFRTSKDPARTLQELIQQGIIGRTQEDADLLEQVLMPKGQLGSMARSNRWQERIGDPLEKIAMGQGRRPHEVRQVALGLLYGDYTGKPIKPGEF